MNCPCCGLEAHGGLPCSPAPDKCLLVPCTWPIRYQVEFCQRALKASHDLLLVYEARSKYPAFAPDIRKKLSDNRASWLKNLHDHETGIIRDLVELKIVIERLRCLSLMTSLFLEKEVDSCMAL